MTPDEHRQRHVALHQALDELLADWLEAHRDWLGRRPLQELRVLELTAWSYAQTQVPDHPAPP